MNVCVTFVIAEREGGTRFLRVWPSQVWSVRKQATFYSEGKGCLVALMVVAAGGLRVQGLHQSLSAPLEAAVFCAFIARQVGLVLADHICP